MGFPRKCGMRALIAVPMLRGMDARVPYVVLTDNLGIDYAPPDAYKLLREGIPEVSLVFRDFFTISPYLLGGFS